MAFAGFFFAALGMLPLAASAAPAPVASLVAVDHPNDVGQAIDLRWALSPDDNSQRTPRAIRGYEIARLAADGNARDVVGTVPYGVDRFTDQQCTRGTLYLYEIVALGTDDTRSAPVRLTHPVRPLRQWFDRSRGGFAVLVALVSGAVLGFTIQARRGRRLHIREIAGLRAIEEAVGRATEMGRPCLFVAGSQDLNEIATVAGINILSHVARTVAEYEATLIVPTSRSLVMTAARETTRAAALAAGRPEAFDDNSVYYVSDEQFAFAAHVSGLMVRERPAACFYAGTFYAESLILAEMGSTVGALQIAGTAEASQLPFLVAACDYTLIGEELFAASSYLSGEPDQLGSLKGQDAGKLLAGALLLVGCLAATWVALWPGSMAAGNVLAFIRNVLLKPGGGG
ncbi:MAG: DUF6754 domain-containing protein [Planctomycetaceae bacterium]